MIIRYKKMVKIFLVLFLIVAVFAQTRCTTTRKPDVSRAPQKKTIETFEPEIVAHKDEIEIRIGDKRLLWMMCPLGMNWNGEICEGKAMRLLWSDAKDACPPGYRMPTHKEMMAIMGNCFSDPGLGSIDSKQCSRCADSETCNRLRFYQSGELGYMCDDRTLYGHWWFDIEEGIIAVGPMNGSSMVRCLREASAAVKQ